jgi:hypothetical protein
MAREGGQVCQEVRDILLCEGVWEGLALIERIMTMYDYLYLELDYEDASRTMRHESSSIFATFSILELPGL